MTGNSDTVGGGSDQPAESAESAENAENPVETAVAAPAPDALAAESDDFEAGERPATGTALVLDLDGYSGPIDVLLALARDQKVDLLQISILQLAEQYLAFVNEVKSRNLELAADYLVMAAWLAYLKSRLLTPDESDEDEPSGEEMAAALKFQLARIQAMQDAGQKLMSRALLHRDVFTRGAPEAFRDTEISIADATLMDVLTAYGAIQRPRKIKTLRIEPSFELHSAEEASKRMRRMLGGGPEWRSIWLFLPDGAETALGRRSAVAATLQASLELAKEGRVEVRQDSLFGKIFVRGTARLNTDIPPPAEAPHDQVTP
ncbi:MAG: segregation and condensation protein A [Rhodospirillales bacterium]